MPDDSLYYLIKKGKVRFKSEDFAETLEEYYKLCEVWWKQQIKSSDREAKKRGALGLLGRDVHNEQATLVLKECGTPADLKRLEQARNRARHAAQKAAAAEAKAKAKAEEAEAKAKAKEADEAAAKAKEAEAASPEVLTTTAGS